MYQLTIDDGTAVAISGHPDWDGAHRALLGYIVEADYYLRSLQNTGPHTSYELVQPADVADAGKPARRRAPRAAGHAVIEQLECCSPGK